MIAGGVRVNRKRCAEYICARNIDDTGVAEERNVNIAVAEVVNRNAADIEAAFVWAGSGHMAKVIDCDGRGALVAGAAIACAIQCGARLVDNHHKRVGTTDSLVLKAIAHVQGVSHPAANVGIAVGVNI